MLAAVEMRAGHSWLRSSPTPEGRCCQWPVAAQPPAGTDVAILTDPGGSVLPRTRARFRRGGSGCDPHRPRRVGAAPCRPAARTWGPRVAILTDPGGSVLPRAGRCPPPRPPKVAILTDPGGSVLLARSRRTGRP